MREWKKVKLKEVLTEITERNKGEKVKNVLSVTNSQGFVNQDKYFEGTVHSADISNYKIVRKNQFAYNPSRVNVGSIDILKNYEMGALSPMYVVFEVDTNKLLPEYFKYYFETNRFYENVKNNTQGSVRNSLSFKSLADFDYLLPPIEEQKRITNVLSNINKIISKLESTIKIRKLIFKHRFKSISNDNSDKFYLKDLVTYKKGFAFSSKKYRTEGCRIIRVTDLGEESISDNVEKIYIDKSEKNNYKDYELFENDLIVTTVGSKPPIYSSIAGRVIKVNKSNEGDLLNQNTIRLRTKENISPSVLYYMFNNREYYDYLSVIMRGNANQGNITVDEVLKYSINMPNYETQKKLEKMIKYEEKIQELLRKKIQNYTKLKKALMQKLLTGKVRVKI